MSSRALASTALPATMPAAVYQGDGVLAVEEIPVPRPGPDEAVLEVSHCGVCGTDLHMVVERWGRPGTVAGHEYAGRVAALGDAVTGWSIGDAAVGGLPETCGHCPACAGGRPSLCSGRDTPGMDGPEQGAFARYVKLRAGRLLPIPEGIPLRAAALTEPLAVALHAVSQSGVEPGDRVLVTGAGPIGALVVAALRSRGVTDVTVSEPGPARRELALRVGASRVVAPDDLERPSRADPGGVVEGAFAVALECSGRAAAMETALGQLARGGTLVLVGAGMDSPRFDPNRILLNELVVTGAFNYDDDGFTDALALLASGAVPVDDLTEAEDVPLDRLQDALEGLAAGRVAGKVLVVPRRTNDQETARA